MRRSPLTSSLVSPARSAWATLSRLVTSRHRAGARVLVAVAAFGLASPWASGRSASAASGRLEPSAASSRTEPTAASAQWTTSVLREIARSEYELKASDEGGGWSAPNRANDLRSTWRDGRLEVTPRDPRSGESWRFGLELLQVDWGAGDPLLLGPVLSEGVDGLVLTWDRDGGVTESYQNDERGIEQVIVLDAPPSGERDGLVDVRARFDGLLAYPAEDGSSILLRTDSGVAVLRISQLVVVDASNDPVPACFEVHDGILSLLLDDHDAVYPLTIDPMLSTPAWKTVGAQAAAGYGTSVATAGDVNGDGFSDVIIGAPGFDAGVTDQGRAFVFLGFTGGLALAPAWTTDGVLFGEALGTSVSTAGDVNGDGFADILVGSPGWDSGQTDEGRLHVFYGHASGPSATSDWRFESNQIDSGLGSSVAPAGDVNNDGFDDIVAGAPRYDAGQTDEGRAFLFLGSAAGPSAAPVWTAEANQVGANLGAVIAPAGDVDGDGFMDVVVGSPLFDNVETDEGRAFLFRGVTGGLALTPAWTAEPNQADARFGASACTAGDTNGDGYADVIVGAPRFDNGQTDEGRVFVYRGSSTGLATASSWTAESDQFGAGMGNAVATAGDLNGDGFADVIVGANAYNAGALRSGRAQVYYGSSAGLRAQVSWTSNGAQQDAAFGTSVAAAGDIDGDGYADVIVGAPFDDVGPADEGSASVFLGAPDGLSRLVAWTAEGNSASSETGYCAAIAGDVNGDGFDDVIVGLPGFNGRGQARVYNGSANGISNVAAWTVLGVLAGGDFGRWVAGAGDVNGDGFSDVIVGQRYYENGQLHEGRAYVYHGSVAGLSTTAAWAVEGDQDDVEYGQTVAGAGDVNGDGYGDVLVAAPYWDTSTIDEGRVFLYYGSALGLSTTAAWTYDSGQTFANLGYKAVGSAGDVNGDGYSDIIVGSLKFFGGQTDEGRAYMFLGSQFGPNSRPDWQVESNQVGARFGYSVGTAGDVNGDGYSDVIVGAREYDRGEANEGVAFVYHGSATGLSTTSGWQGESNQADAYFGYCVASAGDVNADGYSDVIVGAPLYDVALADQGRAYVYLGSAGGVAMTPAWTFDGVQLQGELGNIVAGAGDVNGDGTSDVLVSQHYFSSPELQEGRVLSFFGNDGDGLDFSPRQARVGGATPIDLLGAATDPQARFNLKATGRSPFGRDKVRIEWEPEPLGVAFSGGTAIQRSTWQDTGLPGAQGSGKAFNEAQGTLQRGGPWRWRLRTRARFPLGAAGRWMGFSRNAPSETDLRITIDLDGDFDGIPTDGDMDGTPGNNPCPSGQTMGCDDNCPRDANPDQLDTDMDGQGDACDTDDDNDGFPDTIDNCQKIPNDQTDSDGDGAGDACDNDIDNDGIVDASDNCPSAFNPTQLDTDMDGQGDACDTDDDADGIADGADNCPLVANMGQADNDGDRMGDACDPDDDNDTVPDVSDNCPLLANVGQVDLDADGAGDACDPDDDGDGINDTPDNCPRTPNPSQSDMDGDGIGDACDSCVGVDSDLDGVCDDGDRSGTAGDNPCPAGVTTFCDDNCLSAPNPGQQDGDGDRIGDACDGCPTDPTNVDTDSDTACNDGDGSGVAGDHPCQSGETSGCDDNCPDLANAGQLDTDMDGLGDACDPCPDNPANTDTDMDGMGDACDPCPVDPTNLDTDTDGICDDGDGSGTAGDVPCATGMTTGCDDNCPNVPNATQDDQDSDGLGEPCDSCPTDPTNTCTSINLLRNASLMDLSTAFSQLPTILTAGGDPVLDEARDIFQPGVGALTEVIIAGDGTPVGTGNRGVVIFYEITRRTGPLRVERVNGGADVRLTGW